MIIPEICHNCKYVNPLRSVIDIKGAIKLPNANCLKLERNQNGQLFIILDRYTHKCEKFKGIEQ